MMRGLWAAATGMSCQATQLDVVANNLANVNTNGFKRSRTNFQDLMYQTMKAAGATTASGNQIPTGIQVGMGAQVVSVDKVFSQGDFAQTRNPLDLAIEGKGFFKLLNNSREVYSRSGSFKLDKDRYICDANGNRLQPEFAVPPETVNITIDSGGKLVALGSDGKELGNVQIQLFDFANMGGLLSIGQNLFIPSDASGDAVQGNPGNDQFGNILQGTLEISNVDVVQEMLSMIMAQRAYELGAKAIQTGDDMLQQANSLKR